MLRGGGVHVPTALTPSAGVPSSPGTSGEAGWAGQASTRIPRPRQDFFRCPLALKGFGGSGLSWAPGGQRGAPGSPHPHAKRASPLLTAGGGGSRGGRGRRGGGRGLSAGGASGGRGPSAGGRAGAAGREGVKARGLYDNEPPGNIGREAGRGAAPPPREPEQPEERRPRQPGAEGGGAVAGNPRPRGRALGRGPPRAGERERQGPPRGLS